MSYNTAFLFSKTHRGKGKSHYFGGLGLPNGKECGDLTFDQATSLNLDGKALAVIKDWTVVIDPTLFYEVENHPSVKEPGLFPVVIESRLDGKSTSLGAILFGNSSTYGFTYFNKKRERLFLKSDNEIIHDIGSSTFPSDNFNETEGGEEAIFGIIYEATGLSAKDLEDATYLKFKFDAKHIKWIHD